MSKGYAITVDYTTPKVGRGYNSTTLHLNANNADLAAFLQVLDESVPVAIDERQGGIGAIR